jgi:hypothetical protein
MPLSAVARFYRYYRLGMSYSAMGAVTTIHISAAEAARCALEFCRVLDGGDPFRGGYSSRLRRALYEDED